MQIRSASEARAATLLVPVQLPGFPLSDIDPNQSACVMQTIATCDLYRLLPSARYGHRVPSEAGSICS